MLRNQPEGVHRKVLRKVKKHFVTVTVAGGLVSLAGNVTAYAQEAPSENPTEQTQQDTEPAQDANTTQETEATQETAPTNEQSQEVQTDETQVDQSQTSGETEAPSTPEADTTQSTEQATAEENAETQTPPVESTDQTANEEPASEASTPETTEQTETAQDTQADASQTAEQTQEEVQTPEAAETNEQDQPAQETQATETASTSETTEQTQPTQNTDTASAETNEQTQEEAQAPETAETTQATAQTNNGTGRATIIHTNDIHGRIDAQGESSIDMGMAYIDSIADYYREQGDDVFLLDAGDTTHGTTVINQNEGEDMIRIMNEMGYGAMAPGNHEFNYGVDQLQNLNDQANFPIIASNVEFNEQSNEETGQQVFDSFTEWQTYGNSIGIVGLATQDTPTTTHPNNVQEVDFTDEIEATQEQIDTLSSQFDHMILLSHAGHNIDRQIAENVDGINTIIGGHSHTPVSEEVLVNDTMITQAWEHTKTVGVIHFDFENGNLVNRESYLLTSPENKANEEFVFPNSAVGSEDLVRTIDGLEPDAEIQAMVDTITQEVEQSLQTEIGSTDVFLNGERGDVRTGSTNLGNFITDALRDYVGTDIAIINGGGIRASIDAGTITEGDVLTVLPFINLLEVQELPGSAILEALEYGARLYPEQNGGLLHVSGMEYVADGTREPGNRIVSATIGGQEINPEQVYSMATNDFLAVGGDGYEVFADYPVTLSTGELFSTIVMDYVASFDGPIEVDETERFVITDTPVETEETPGEEQQPANNYGPDANATDAFEVGQPTYSVDQNRTLEVNQLGDSYVVPNVPYDEGATEIIAFNPANQYLYSINGYNGTVEIFDTTNLETDGLQLIGELSLSDYGIEAGGLTSVDIHPSNEFIAVTAQAPEVTDPGYAVFIGANGEYLSHVNVGSLPDDLTFTNDGTRLLTANEGEPNDDYTVNPAGGISVITIGEDPAQITQDDVQTINIDPTQFDLPENFRFVGPNEEQALLNFEPEYVAVDQNDDYAYLTLQEVNSIAKFNLNTLQFEDIGFLGYKDHSIPGNELDPSDEDGLLQPRRLPVLGLHQPDAISLFETNGETYILTPNEGDSQDYDGYSEETRVSDLAEAGLINLNADHFEGFTQEEIDELVANGLFDDDQLGRLTVTTDHPFINEAGQHEALVAYGARSFSVVRASDMEVVYDSGADFENYLLENYPELYNVDIDDHETYNLDGRSDNKASEPETVEVGVVNGVPYAFIAQERTSGFFIYDISNPEEPVFVDFFVDENYVDIAPEGLEFVAAEDNIYGVPMLYASYESSGSIAAYTLNSLIDGEQTDGETTPEVRPEEGQTPRPEETPEGPIADEITDLEDHLDDVESEYTSITDRIEELHNELNNPEADRDAIIDEIAELEFQLRNLANEHALTVEEISQLHDELDRSEQGSDKETSKVDQDADFSEVSDSVEVDGDVDSDDVAETDRDADEDSFDSVDDIVDHIEEEKAAQEDAEDSDDAEGERLPDTATSTGLLGLAGLASLVTGTAASIFDKKKRK